MHAYIHTYIHTYIHRARNIKNTPVINRDPNSHLVAQLRKEIAWLRQVIKDHGIIISGAHSSGGVYVCTYYKISACFCICMFLYMYIYTHTHIYIHIYTYGSVYMYIYIHVCIYIYIYIYTYTSKKLHGSDRLSKTMA